MVEMVVFWSVIFLREPPRVYWVPMSIQACAALREQHAHRYRVLNECLPWHMTRKGNKAIYPN